MIKTSVDQERVLQSLAGLYSQFQETNDENNMRKLKQLMKKAADEEVQLAFCGHFSAGKSSMINHLLGERVLPSSPIPTSANVVKLKQGEDLMKVLFFDGKHAIFEGKRDIKEIKAYCKEGNIKEIHISSKGFPLKGQSAVLDTPGIDSTDDAHRVSTQSTLHLADIILYVMDYNHVQSQENFLFAKKMTEMGKKLYLVINQIDKHDEEELPFADYKRNTADAFHQWDIQPGGIFYTSLRRLDHPHNQISELRDFIHIRLAEEKQRVHESILTAAAHLAEDHLLYLEEQRRIGFDQANRLLEPLTESEQKAIRASVQELKGRLDSTHAFPEAHHRQSLAELNELLKNAYLLTSESREIIRSYLESRHEGFKVGFLFSKNKTEAEREQREMALLAELQERTKTQLEWHVRQLAQNWLKGAGIDSLELEASVQGITVPVEIEAVRSLVSNQTYVTGDYVLLFSDKVSELIKKTAKDQLLSFYGDLKKEIENTQSRKAREIKAELGELQVFADALSLLEEVAAEKEKAKQRCEAIVENSGAVQAVQVERLLSEMVEEEQRNLIEIEGLQASEPLKEVVVQKTSVQEAADRQTKANPALWVEKLEAAAGLIAPLQGFSGMRKEMVEKAARMAGKTYTVALFGAFSAGKSSFANALFGEKILPVSPNPTTAVINKVMMPSGGHSNRTANIKLKSREMILEDVKLACRSFGQDPENLEAAYQFAKAGIKESQSPDGEEKAHLAFLNAFLEGYTAVKEKLGQQFVVSYEEYAQFAAVESKSCFVEEIVLYYDCSLTRSGIVLVDTPGADSINARHTNAAFHYIKNSDAILFVTYYNHPFAKSDREFLIQLGRVKDAFSMDKMFFICNAVDLAADEEELTDVLAYISSQLEGFGIRFPRLFPVSSKAALLEQRKDYLFAHPFLKDSGLPAFRQSFDHFIQHELIDLACESARSSIERAARQLAGMIQAATSSAEEKQQRLEILNEQYNGLKAFAVSEGTDVEMDQLNKEIEELLYYIKQRVFLRFNEFFKESFNPSVLKEDGRNMKRQLQKALQELIGSIGFDLEQEMRATSVRTERFVWKLVRNKEAKYQNRLTDVWQSAEISDFAENAYDVPVYDQAFSQLDAGQFKKELAIFKNAKSFFEKNEKAKMSEALKSAIEPHAEAYLSGQGEAAKLYYGNLLEIELVKLKTHTEIEMESLYEGFRSVLRTDVDVDGLRSKETGLRQLMSAGS
ncbi:MAG: dynamin family protein [Bacillus sp. (in: firmicutes)]